ncbi:MAG: hypothetical protein ABI366_10570, partial [Ginsengibacter sp.]
MAENPLLAQLAQISGEFIAAKQSSSAGIKEFQNLIASALLQNQSVETLQDSHLFEKMTSYTAEQLSTEELSQLRKVLETNSAGTPVDKGIRVFRREVPFASSQAKGSVPDWGRGAAVAKTIGPLINKLGRPIVFDIYKVVPGVKIILQGAANPSLILPLKVRTILQFNT